jgi:hypothetical protein
MFPKTRSHNYVLLQHPGFYQFPVSLRKRYPLHFHHIIISGLLLVYYQDNIIVPYPIIFIKKLYLRKPAQLFTGAFITGAPQGALASAEARSVPQNGAVHPQMPLLAERTVCLKQRMSDYLLCSTFS